MSRHLQLRRFFVVGALMGAAFGASAATPAAASVATLPSASIYHLSTPLTDQDAKQFKLEDRRGRPMLVSMFYTSCQFVCPMLVDALRETEAKLTPAQRERLSILMVSFDPEHDTVSVLKATAEQRRLEPAHWTLARTDAGNVRKLAAVLGIQYRALANGEFNHTTSLILIDSAGRIVGRTARLGDSDPNFVKLVRATVQSDPQ